jgi:hypothetical protein
MKPGRELDALVAEKVMGWEPWPSQIGSDRWKGPDGEPRYTWIEARAFAGLMEWRPSTSISNAWEVVEKLLTQLGQQDFHIEHLEGMGWSVATCHEDTGWKGWITADTAPHAICLAALKAVGVNPDTK